MSWNGTGSRTWMAWSFGLFLMERPNVCLVGLNWSESCDFGVPMAVLLVFWRNSGIVCVTSCLDLGVFVLRVGLGLLSV